MKLRIITLNLFVAIAYFIGGYAGLKLAIPPSNAAAIWPATGIALSAILISGPRVLFGVFLGGLMVQTASFIDTSTIESIISSLTMGTIISIGGMCQAWLGATLGNRILKKDPNLLKERCILMFILLVGPVSCIISPSVGITTLWVKGILTYQDIPLAWSTWWLGDSIGVLVFSPIVLCFFAKPRHIWQQRIFTVAVPLCILSFIAFLIFDISYKQEMKHVNDTFEKNTISFANELEKSINLHIESTNHLKEFYDSTNYVTKEEFRSFVQPKLSRYPEIQALEWISKVDHTERVVFENGINRKIMVSDENGNMTVSPDKDFYYSIQYVEPYEGNENALGFDVLSKPISRQTAETACSSGKVSVSGILQLVQEKNSEISVVFYAPVYKNKQFQDCENLLGLTASIFRLENEIKHIQEKFSDYKLSIALKEKSKIFFDDRSGKEIEHSIPSKFKFKKSYQLSVANKLWEIEFKPDKGFISIYSTWLIWIIIVGGFLVCALSGIGLLMLTGRYLHTEDLITLRTKELNNEIQERMLAEETLSYQASHDALTGLVNRREFERRASRILESMTPDIDEHALCFMDLDQFKVVNDTCGHMAGDELLRQLTSELLDVVRKRDTLARLGGDEFGVMMEHCSLDNAYRVATTILNTIQNYQFIWDDKSFKVGVSIGLVPITQSTANLTDLLKDADAACYMAKDKGRSRIHVAHAEDIETAQRHGEMQWVSRLHDALEKDLFCLYSQAIVPLDNEKATHYELLIRMQNEDGTVIPPGAFLPAAERYNLAAQIDRWVIEQSFKKLAEHPSFLDKLNFCSINLSGQSLTDSNLLEFIIEKFEKSDGLARKICFEITETAAISNLSMAMKFISELKILGCRFALDDFGSGLSSFAYLKSLPVDYLKIDGIFVKDIVNDRIDHAMVKSINEIGQVMGMKTIAEFVENDEIKGMLREIGVNYAQGYGIEKPQSFDKLITNNIS